MDTHFYTDDFMWNVLGIQALPDRLQHFTSVDALEKILSSKTLRFARLDTVNDPEEADAVDLPGASTSVFVSCWTDAKRDALPMWSMYGDDFSGVRISLPSNMFAGRKSPNVFEDGGAIVTFDGAIEIQRNFPAMGARGCAIIGPNKVYYSDDARYRRPQMIHRRRGRAQVVPFDLGMVKSLDWSFEQEWRFKISLLAFSGYYPDDAYFNEVTLDLVTYPVTTDHLLVPMDPTALDEMQVMLGPKASREVVDRVTGLLQLYAPKATLLRSERKIR